MLPRGYGESAWPQDRGLSAAGIALTWAAKPRLSQSLNPWSCFQIPGRLSSPGPHRCLVEIRS